MSVFSGPRLGSRHMVGRKEELTALCAAATNPPSVALIEGEPGVGKTRLVEELTAALTARGVLVGRCRPLREPLPLTPILQAIVGAEDLVRGIGFSPLAGALRPLIPELEDCLPPTPDPLGDPRAERLRQFRALVAILDAVGPTVVVVEDLHWADELTGEFIRFLMSDLPVQLCLVLTYRREDLTDASVLADPLGRLPQHVRDLRIDLSALNSSDVRALVGDILDTAQVSERFAGYLHERTGGVPFLVEEVLRLLLDRGDIVRGEGGWVRRSLDDFVLPPTVRDFVLERVGRLSSDAQKVIRAAAVLGVPETEGVLRSAARLAPGRARAAIALGLQVGLLREAEHDRYELRHALARDAVEDALSSPERAQLHLRAARVLEQTAPKPYPRLAHHYRVGGERPRWIRCAEAAADQASQLGDHQSAARWLADVLAVPDLPTATRTRLALKLGQAARYGLAHRLAIPILASLVDGDDIPVGSRGELRLSLAWALYQAGNTAACCTELERALGDLKHRPGLAASAMSTLALPWLSSDLRIEDHLRWMDLAVRTVARTRDPVERLVVAGDRAFLLTLIGDPAAPSAVRQLPSSMTSPEGERAIIRAKGNLAYASLCVGDVRAAKTFARDAVELAAASGAMREESSERAKAALVDLSMGLWDGLSDRVREHLERWQDVGFMANELLLVLGSLLLAEGHVDEAQERLTAAREASVATADLPIAILAAASLARLLLAEGRPEAAAVTLREVLGPVAAKGTWVWAGDAIVVLEEALQAGEGKGEAASLLDEFRNGIAGRRAPGARAALNHAQGLRLAGEGEVEAAASRLTAAETRWNRLPRPYEAARASEARGAVLLGSNPEGAASALSSALARFEALGATWDAQRVRRRLRSAGVRTPRTWKGGRKGYGDRLSPREAEVARLLGQGLKTREIADRLFLSPRTVEGHVANATRKLGLGTRAALAVAMVESEKTAESPETPDAALATSPK